jgi:bifunctional non-homologous end joining protein LigD
MCGSIARRASVPATPLKRKSQRCSPCHFSERALTELYGGLQTIRRATCPFVNLPEKRPRRWGLGITPLVMKRCDWVEPVLVAQVKFTEWTSDQQLRQPVFLGLRTDKQAKDVVREAG